MYSRSVVEPHSLKMAGKQGAHYSLIKNRDARSDMQKLVEIPGEETFTYEDGQREMW